eukprot:CAMPEP_0177608808 /NCGR_PEP_ID=MMETSP0419_2-20121207/18686_1 /TAXON_ID=582737 /ORGANISM="Tetraselmis sp., Strain GSL018" /LENGTH=220 /DNA_ID=CAMNT_0019103557 /DNA_START=379 /DNA_END=1041 /DNA_ORIENTATION=-
MEVELDCLRSLNHPNIVRCVESLSCEGGVYLLTEPLYKIDLQAVLVEKGKLEESEARSVMTQLMSAVSHMHRNGVVHRNIKPSKIVLKMHNNFDSLILVGFGLAALERPEEPLTTSCGSALYVAPEVVQPNCSYDKKCDVWSIGALLFHLLTGYPPVVAKTVNELLSKIRRGKFNTSHFEWLNLSDSAKDLVSQLLTVDASQRPTVDEIIRHPWLTKTSR